MSAFGSRTFVLALLRARANPAREGSEEEDPEEVRARIVIQADGARWDEDTEPATPWALPRAHD